MTNLKKPLTLIYKLKINNDLNDARSRFISLFLKNDLEIKTEKDAKRIFIKKILVSVINLTII